MSDAYIGEIRLVPYGQNNSPRGWMFCSGQLVAVNDYQELFALIGISYGGNGTTNFALPNLNGRVLVGQGTGTTNPVPTPVGGPALTARAVGQTGGVESVVLTAGQIPNHEHQFMASTMENTTPTPGSSVVYGSSTAATFKHYTSPVPNPAPKMFPLNVQTVEEAGSNAAHANLMPGLGLRYIICVKYALFPQRP